MTPRDFTLRLVSYRRIVRGRKVWCRTVQAFSLDGECLDAEAVWECDYSSRRDFAAATEKAERDVMMEAAWIVAARDKERKG